MYDRIRRARDVIGVTRRRVRLAVLLIWRRIDLSRDRTEPDLAQMQRDWTELGRATERFQDAVVREHERRTTVDSPNAPGLVDRR